MKLVTVLSIMILGLVTHAEDKSSGCGLGWQVVQRQSLLSSATRSIINASTSSTLGMTLGTSGCDRHSIVDNNKMDVHYAEANYHELMVEMGQGSGEHLIGFAMTLGCDKGQISDFSNAAQKNYDSIFAPSGSNPSQVVDSVKSTMSSEKICGYNNI